MKPNLALSILSAALLGKSVVAFMRGGAPVKGTVSWIGSVHGNWTATVQPDEGGEGIAFPLHRVGAFADSPEANDLAAAGKAFASAKADAAQAFAEQAFAEQLASEALADDAGDTCGGDCGDSKNGDE